MNNFHTISINFAQIGNIIWIFDRLQIGSQSQQTISKLQLYFMNYLLLYFAFGMLLVYLIHAWFHSMWHKPKSQTRVSIIEYTQKVVNLILHTQPVTEKHYKLYA